VKPLDLIPRLTLIMLILNTHHEPFLLVGAAVVCAAAFLQPRVYRNGWFWLAVAAALGAWNFTHWHPLDNHVIFTNTWLVCLGVGLLGPDPEHATKRTAQLAIGLCFLFATIWKVTTPAYTSGEFFELSLLADDRFRAAAQWFGGLDGDDWKANNSSLGALYAEPDETAVALRSTDRVEGVARAMTVHGLVLEGAIALAFLAPLRALVRVRAGLLGAFALTTYAVVPVSGFGCLLMTMGAAQADDDRARRRWVGGLVAVALWGALWPSLRP
jgi:hypothetical protein